MFLVCKHCFRALRVLGDDAAVETLLGEKSFCASVNYPCPDCAQPMRTFREEDIDPDEHFTLRIVDVTPEEAFVAFNGLGLPSEQACSLQALRSLFVRQPVLQVHGRELQGTGRCCLDCIEFSDGSKVYFGASPQGAIAYRIAPPPAYAEKVLREG